jgi:hypothetical protein
MSVARLVLLTTQRLAEPRGLEGGHSLGALPAHWPSCASPRRRAACRQPRARTAARALPPPHSACCLVPLRLRVRSHACTALADACLRAVPRVEEATRRGRGRALTSCAAPPPARPTPPSTSTSPAWWWRPPSAPAEPSSARPLSLGGRVSPQLLRFQLQALCAYRAPHPLRACPLQRATPGADMMPRAQRRRTRRRRAA